MNGNLVVMIKDHYIDFVFGLSKIPLATMRKSYKKIDDLEMLLVSFFLKNNIGSKDIKNIIFVTDFTNFIKKTKKCAFGYVQIGDTQDGQLKDKKLLKDIDLEVYPFHVADLNSDQYKSQLAKYIDMLYKKGIHKIALNSFFSTLHPHREKQLIEDIKDLCSDTFKIYPSQRYHSFNYLLRENAMFLDLLLFKPVNDFINKINITFDHLKMNAKIYFMRGNGTLTTLRKASLSPIFTWESIFAAQLIGASIATGERDAFILTNHYEGIKMGMVQNHYPKRSETFSNFEGLHIPNDFPRTIYFNTVPDHKKWSRFLKHNNIFTGPVPILCLMDQLPSYPFFSYPVIEIKNHPSIIAQGALHSLFQLELASIISTSDKDIIEKEKEELVKKSKKILEKDNIKLENITYMFELIPIKYIRKNASYIKLCVKGNIE